MLVYSYQDNSSNNCLVVNIFIQSEKAGSIVEKPIILVDILLLAYILITDALMLIGLWKTNKKFDTILKLYFCLGAADLLFALCGLATSLAPLLSSVKRLQAFECTLLNEFIITSYLTLFMLEPLLLLVMISTRLVTICTARGSMVHEFIQRKSYLALVIVFIVLCCCPFGLFRYVKRLNSQDVAIYELVYFSSLTGFALLSVLLNAVLLRMLSQNAIIYAESRVTNSVHKRAAKTLLIMVFVILLGNVPNLILILLITIELKDGNYQTVDKVLKHYVGYASVVSLLGIGLNSNIFIIRSGSIRKYFRKTLRI